MATSISFDSPSSIEFTSDQLSSLDKISNWDIDSIKPHENLYDRVHFIAEDFIPMVMISDHSNPAPRDFYLPLHGLIQETDFSLII